MKVLALKEKFPRLFEQNRCGVYCGDGWYTILEKLCATLNSLATPPHVVQIKEKFGGLRFYVDLREGCSEQDAEVIDKSIQFTESMSFYVCEDCGTTNDVTVAGRSWLRTLCPACRQTMLDKKGKV